jgi:hypothetical protein
MIKLIRSTSLACLIIFAITASGKAEEVKKKSVDKQQIVGVWMPVEVETFDGEAKPRIEYKENGTFRMQSQFGDEKAGKWKWIEDDTIELAYSEGDKVVKIKLLELTKDTLVTHVRRDTKHVRLESWSAKEPKSSDSKDAAKPNCANKP